MWKCIQGGRRNRYALLLLHDHLSFAQGTMYSLIVPLNPNQSIIVYTSVMYYSVVFCLRIVFVSILKHYDNRNVCCAVLHLTTAVTDARLRRLPFGLTLLVSRTRTNFGDRT